jgi:hypothetical protein
MAKLLIVDDDQAMLRLYRARFPGDWELIATKEPEQTLAFGARAQAGCDYLGPHDA